MLFLKIDKKFLLKKFKKVNLKEEIKQILQNNENKYKNFKSLLDIIDSEDYN